MAVIPTGGIFNTLTFGGVCSADYGIYITGEPVYNAPERAVELTAIPGRNGAIPVDLGRWENIEVVYPASTGQGSQVDFRTAVGDFRNAVASKRGYQRLVDTYHPDEFRMGLFISGLDVEPTASGKAGEFELRFNCKPQRFLTSGETAVAVANNGTITNPTLLDASPVLEVKGYGWMKIGDYGFELHNLPLGVVTVLPPVERTQTAQSVTYNYNLNSNLYLAGDTIALTGFYLSGTFVCTESVDPDETTVSQSGDVSLDFALSYVNDGILNRPAFTIYGGAVEFTAGTAATHTTTITMQFESVNATASTVTLQVMVKYTPGTQQLSFGLSYTCPDDVTQPKPTSISLAETKANSTVPNTGNSAYIDCEIGEAYKIEGGEMVSINGVTYLGAELPVLVPGSNTVNYENTITSFKIVPRWWRL